MGKKQSNKNKIIEELKVIPIVQHACQKIGVPRSTYYRWRTEDADFSSRCDSSMDPGIESINDLAESQLIIRIKNGDYKSITYWLSHHKDTYKEDKSKKELNMATWTDLMLATEEYEKDNKPRF